MLILLIPLSPDPSSLVDFAAICSRKTLPSPLKTLIFNNVFLVRKEIPLSDYLNFLINTISKIQKTARLTFEPVRESNVWRVTEALVRTGSGGNLLNKQMFPVVSSWLGTTGATGIDSVWVGLRVVGEVFGSQSQIKINSEIGKLIPPAILSILSSGLIRDENREAVDYSLGLVMSLENVTRDTLTLFMGADADTGTCIFVNFLTVLQKLPAIAATTTTTTTTQTKAKFREFKTWLENQQKEEASLINSKLILTVEESFLS